MGWFDGLAQAQQAAQQNGLTNAAQAGAGSLASLGGGQAGPKGPGGAMSWMQPSPQPVPGQPPRQLDQPNPNGQYTGIDWDQHLIGSRPGEPGFDPNKGFNQILYPGGQLPPGWQPNTGGMNPSMPTMNPDLLKRFMDPNFDPRMEPGFHDPQIPGGMTTDQGFPEAGNRGSGQPINQPMSGGWVPGQPDFMGGTPLTADNMQQQLQAAGRLGMGGSLQSLGGGQLNSSGMVNLRGPDGSMKAVPQSDMAHWLSKGAVRV